MKPIVDFIEQQIKANIYRGASLAILTQESWQEYYLGTLDGKQRVQENLTYDLASVSKVVGVGTVMLKLLAEQSMTLDDKLTDYYPAFHDSSVTLRQLLTHTSGLDPFIPNRDSLNAQELMAALNHLTVTPDKSFRYTDVNFLLLGFMLEAYFGKSLAAIFEEQVFLPFGMSATSFGPVAVAVPTSLEGPVGLVHDPKARVLGEHAGSAGLFSTLKDLERFLEHHLRDDFASSLTKNMAAGSKSRAVAWDLQDDWLLHTGYTGTFIMLNQRTQQAVIFLSNRTYDKDERQQWILDRDELIALIKTSLVKESYRV